MGEKEKTYLHGASSYLPAEAHHCSLKSYMCLELMLKLPVQITQSHILKNSSCSLCSVPDP